MTGSKQTIFGTCQSHSLVPWPLPTASICIMQTRWGKACEIWSRVLIMDTPEYQSPSIVLGAHYRFLGMCLVALIVPTPFTALGNLVMSGRLKVVVSMQRHRDSSLCTMAFGARV